MYGMIADQCTVHPCYGGTPHTNALCTVQHPELRRQRPEARTAPHRVAPDLLSQYAGEVHDW